VSTTFPPPDPDRHGWAELLTLVGAIRRLAYSQVLAPMMRCAESGMRSPTTTTATDVESTDNGPPLSAGGGPFRCR
jgi:hypothetical protein